MSAKCTLKKAAVGFSKAVVHEKGTLAFAEGAGKDRSTFSVEPSASGSCAHAVEAIPAASNSRAPNTARNEIPLFDACGVTDDLAHLDGFGNAVDDKWYGLSCGFRNKISLTKKAGVR